MTLLKVWMELYYVPDYSHMVVVQKPGKLCSLKLCL